MSVKPRLPVPAILGPYLNPPEDALVLCGNEKSRIRALDRTQPMLPLWSGKPRRLTATSTRHSTTCLPAALSVHDGTVTGRRMDKNSHTTLLSFLKHLYRSNAGTHLPIIMDNPSLHQHKEMMDWVQRRRCLAIAFTPTYASWLSQVKIGFTIFTRDVIRGGIGKSKQHRIDQIMQYIKQYIKQYSRERAHPFAWTSTGKPLIA